MAFNGAALKFISAFTVGAGSPGGAYVVTVQAQPLGSYPATGDLVADLITAINALPESRVKVAAGVQPDNVFISSTIPGVWTWNPATNRIQSWSALTPTEHATAVYTAGELASVMRITMIFPLYGSMSR